jgi:hypothetical protein
MKLRFYARSGHLCSLPGPRVTGTLPKYVGRRVRVVDGEIRNEILDEPAEFDSASREGQRLLRRMIVDHKDPPLIPADEATARFCGVPFEPKGGERRATRAPKPESKVEPKGAA